MVLSSFSIAINFVCLPFLCGRNPSKQKRSQGNPLATKAGTKAVGPGKHSTSIPSATHSLDNKKPGSEIPGVPASETKTAKEQLFILSIVELNALCSLCE